MHIIEYLKQLWWDWQHPTTVSLGWNIEGLLNGRNHPEPTKLINKDGDLVNDWEHRYE